MWRRSALDATLAGWVAAKMPMSYRPGRLVSISHVSVPDVALAASNGEQVDGDGESTGCSDLRRRRWHSGDAYPIVICVTRSTRRFLVYSSSILVELPGANQITWVQESQREG